MGDNKEEENENIVEDKLQLVELESTETDKKYSQIYMKKRYKLEVGKSYYGMYFSDKELLAIFKNNMKDRKKIELPLLVVDIQKLNFVDFRIPLRLYDLKLQNNEYSLTLRFQSEEKKNNAGDKIRKRVKRLQREDVDEGDFLVTEFTKMNHIERKYQIAKMLEKNSFHLHIQKYDYGKYFSFDYLSKFSDIYQKESETHEKLFNKIFFGQVHLFEFQDPAMDDAQIQNQINQSSDPLFGIFVLSRGVYNLKKFQLQQYAGIIRDFTEKKYIMDWMEFDTFYLFEKKHLKKDCKNVNIPYQLVLDVMKLESMSYVDGKLLAIKLKYPKMIRVLVFENIIECTKFYTYFMIMYYNAIESYNSLHHDIKLNIRVLFDDEKFNKMENVILVLIDQLNYQYQKKKAEEDPNQIFDEDNKSLEVVTIFLEQLMIAFYSLKNMENEFNKLKVLINRIQEQFFDNIKLILQNPYSVLETIETALAECNNHFNTLNTWSIFDGRFSLLYIFLTHFYKIKFINISLENQSIKILDYYNDDKMYNDEKSFFAVWIKQVRTEIDDLKKLHGNQIFPSVISEYINVVFSTFYRNFDAMIDHPDFEITHRQASIVIKDFQHTSKTLESLKAKIVKEYSVNIDYLNVSIRTERMVNLEESIVNKLLKFMLKQYQEETREKIFSMNINKFNLDFLKKLNKQIFSDIVVFKRKYQKQFEQQKMNVLIQSLIDYLSQHSQQDIYDNIKTVVDSFEFQINKSQFKEDSTFETQQYFLNQLRDFFRKNANMDKSVIRISNIQCLLDFQLTKDQLLSLISLKKCSLLMKDQMNSIIIDSFRQKHDMQKVIERKKKANRIFKIVMTVTKFIIRITHGKKLRVFQRMQDIESVKGSVQVQKGFDLENLKLIDDYRVRFAKVNKEYAQKNLGVVKIDDPPNTLKEDQFDFIKGFVKFTEKRIIIKNEQKKLIIDANIWNVQKSKIAHADIRYGLMLIFKNSFIVLQFLTRKHQHQVNEICQQMVASKKDGFSNTIPFVICEIEKAKKSGKMIKNLYKNTKYVFTKPKIWKKEKPAFSQNLDYCRFEVYQKRKVNNDKKIEIVKRRKPYDFFRKMSNVEQVLNDQLRKFYEKQEAHKRKLMGTDKDGDKDSDSDSEDSQKKSFVAEQRKQSEEFIKSQIEKAKLKASTLEYRYSKKINPDDPDLEENFKVTTDNYTQDLGNMTVSKREEKYQESKVNKRKVIEKNKEEQLQLLKKIIIC